MTTSSSHSPVEATARAAAANPRPRVRDAFRLFADLRLRVKLIVSFLAVVVLSTAVSALVTDSVVRSELTQQVGQDLRSRADSVASQISGELLRNRDLLQTIAADRLTREAVKSANATSTADPA